MKREVLGFYMKLLGSSAPELLVFNPLIMKFGSVLSINQQQYLMDPIKDEEITLALNSCADLKAPCCDRYNVFSSKSLGD